MRRMMRTLLLALCLSALPSAARAQTTMDLSTLDLGIQQIQQNTFLFDSINRSTATTPGGSTSGSRGTRRPAPAPTTRPGGTGTGTSAGSGQPLAAQTTFRPVAASIVPQSWAWQMAKTPEKRARLEKFFVALLEDYKAMAKDRGAPLNDVARASSFAVGTSYDVYNEGRMLGERPFQAMREQMYAALAASPKFQTLDDRQRQEMYESYILLGMFVSVMYENAVKDHDAELAAKMRKLARIQLEGAFGVPVERLRFTDEGVRF